MMRPWLQGLFLLSYSLALAGCQATPRTLGREAPRERALAVAFSPDGQLLAAGLNDGTLRVWHFASGRELGRVSGFDTTGQSPGQRVAFSADGMLIAFAGTRATVRVWSPFGAEPPFQFRGHTSPVREVLFAPDGVRLISVSGDTRIDSRGRTVSSPLRILAHHLETAHVVSHFEGGRGVLAVAMAPNGSTAAHVLAPSGALPQITICDLRRSETTQVIVAEDAGVAMAFSPDSQLLFCGTSVYEASSGQRVRSLPHPASAFTDSHTLLILRQGPSRAAASGSDGNEDSLGSGNASSAAGNGAPWFEPIWFDVWTGDSHRGQRRTILPPPFAPPLPSAFPPDHQSFIDEHLRQWMLLR